MVAVEERRGKKIKEVRINDVGKNGVRNWNESISLCVVRRKDEDDLDCG